MKEIYNNTIIKTEYPGHGKQIVEFYKSLGFLNFYGRMGTNDGDVYYGVKENCIDIWVDPPKELKLIKLELDIWI